MSIDITKVKELLSVLKFELSQNIWEISFKAHNNYKIEVDLTSGRINYGDLIKIGDLTTSNLTIPENLVVLECVVRLLNKGYKPQSLFLEEKWTLGRTAKGGKADITVRSLDDKILFIVECKTWGREYKKEKDATQLKGGQLFSYLRQDRNCQYLCLYTSIVENNAAIYQNAIIKAKDDDKLIEMFDSGDKNIKLFREAKNEEEIFNAWKESYSCYYHPNGIFDNEANAYSIELKPLKIKDLKALTDTDGGFIYNQFAEILRHNNISDRENAFNKMISLFLCKIVDENKDEDEVADFQWREGQDTYEEVQDRLQFLYKTGMKDYLKEDVVYFENDYVDKAFKYNRASVAREEITKMLKALKFYTNNEFAFKEVHNEKLFEQNAKVLNEVIQLLQPYRIKYSVREQFLGNLFELLLNAGVKQSEGQFFTPIPITSFIINSLPFDEMIEENKKNKNTNYLPKLVDYACGSGHFLTESIDSIQKAASRQNLEEAKNTLWSRDYIFGIERDYRLARVAKIACFMNGAGNINIIHGDGLEDHIELGGSETFDVVVSNPPYSIKDFKQHLNLRLNSFNSLEYLTNNSSEIEVLFIERMHQLLKTDGYAGIVLPSSILSNSGVYIHARKILLQYFYVKAVVELGGGTFIGTGTTTVVLFLKKRRDNDFRHYTYRADDLYNYGNRNGFEYNDNYLLEEYCEQIDIPIEDYLLLLKSNSNGNYGVPEEFKDTELYKSYEEEFENLTEIKNVRKRLAGYSIMGNNSQVELDRRFFKFIINMEKEKFIYFTLSRDQAVVIVKSGEKAVEKEFLGYEWSKRRGFEGMIRLGEGKLFDKDNPYNEKKVSSYIRKNMLGNTPDSIDPSISDHLAVQILSQMLDFDHPDLDLRISIDPKSKLKQSTRFPSIRFDKIAQLKYGKALTSKNRIDGEYSVMGSNGIDGNHKEFLVKGPGVVVGRKGSAGKVVFSEGNFWPIDTTYWLDADHKKISPLFAYWLLKWLDLTTLVGKKAIGVPGLNRKDVHRSFIPDVPISIQEKIIGEITKIDENLKDADLLKISVMDKYLA